MLNIELFINATKIFNKFINCIINKYDYIIKYKVKSNILIKVYTINEETIFNISIEYRTYLILL